MSRDGRLLQGGDPGGGGGRQAGGALSAGGAPRGVFRGGARPGAADGRSRDDRGREEGRGMRV